MPDTKKRLASKKTLEIFTKDPDSRLTYVLWQTQRATERLLAEELETLKSSLSQFRVLMHLVQDPKLTGAELARRLAITPQSVSTTVSEAKKQGLLRTTPHAVHRGLVEIEITDEGIELLEAAKQRLLDIEQRITSDLSDAERNTLRELLIRVRSKARSC